MQAAVKRQVVTSVDINHRSCRLVTTVCVMRVCHAHRTAGMLCPACARASLTSLPAWRPCCSAGPRSNSSSRAQAQGRRPQQHAWRRQERAAQHPRECLSQGQACPARLALLATLACREEQRELSAKWRSSGQVRVMICTAVGWGGGWMESQGQGMRTAGYTLLNLRPD
jgi:hypothetical protein